MLSGISPSIHSCCGDFHRKKKTPVFLLYSPEILLICREFKKCFGTASVKQSIEKFLITIDQRIQFVRKCEHYMKIEWIWEDILLSRKVTLASKGPDPQIKKLKLKNTTKIATVSNIVPDCWVYVSDRRVKMGRFQIYNNWSPYMIKDLEHTVWLGLEYFVTEGDECWITI